MPTHFTIGPINVFGGGDYPPAAEEDARQNRDGLWTLMYSNAMASGNTVPTAVGVESPDLHLAATTPWLASVERRIQDSTMPNEYGEWSTPEWISEDVGRAAISFFQNSADVLPGEPFLYASLSGDLVAEFETAKGSMTTIISPEDTILFATPADYLQSPIEVTLKRGTNRLREEVRAFSQLIAPAHGPMGTRR